MFVFIDHSLGDDKVQYAWIYYTFAGFIRFSFLLHSSKIEILQAPSFCLSCDKLQVSDSLFFSSSLYTMNNKLSLISR